MNMGGLGALVLLVMVATIWLLVLALADLTRRPAQVWDEAGHNQLVWALVVIFVGLIGPALYLIIARPGLEAASARLRSHSESR